MSELVTPPGSTTPTSLEDLRAWLTACVANYVTASAEEIEPTTPMSSYGLDSVSAISLLVEIEDHFGLELEPDAVWQHPTIDALAALLGDRVAAAAPRAADA